MYTIITVGSVDKDSSSFCQLLSTCKGTPISAIRNLYIMCALAQVCYKCGRMCLFMTMCLLGRISRAKRYDDSIRIYVKAWHSFFILCSLLIKPVPITLEDFFMTLLHYYISLFVRQVFFF